MIKRIICLLWLLTSTLAFALAEDPYPFTSRQDAARFAMLTNEIRCVVCQNQNIADSNAPLANDLRDKVYLMVLDKKSNADIKSYLVHRYGEFILLQPRLSKATFLLWSFPLLGLLFAFFLLFRRIKNTSLPSM